MTPRRITSPQDEGLDELTRLLGELAPQLESADSAWPAQQLRLCGEYGVFEWFLEPELGGQGWSEPDLIRGYLRLSAACLTTTFVITQRTGACQRIADSDNAFPRQELLPDLLRGNLFATVGISHLTTSRRHEARPVLRATLDDDTVTLDGYSPWVTGSTAASVVVVGATLDDGREVLVAAATDQPGVTVPPPTQLVGLTASQTGPIHFERARFHRQWLLAGPVANVMQQGTTPWQGQQPGAASRSGGPQRGQRRRLCRGTPRRSLVSRGPVLSGLELPAARDRRQPVRTGGHRLTFAQLAIQARLIPYYCREE